MASRIFSKLFRATMAWAAVRMLSTHGDDIVLSSLVHGSRHSTTVVDDSLNQHAREGEIHSGRDNRSVNELISVSKLRRKPDSNLIPR